MITDEVKQSFTKWAQLPQNKRSEFCSRIKNRQSANKLKNSARGAAALLRRVKIGFRGRLCFGAAM